MLRGARRRLSRCDDVDHRGRAMRERDDEIHAARCIPFMGKSHRVDGTSKSKTRAGTQLAIEIFHPGEMRNPIPESRQPERRDQTSTAQALTPTAGVRQVDRHKPGLAFHFRATIGMGRRLHGGAADERFQKQEELLSKHESFLHRLLLVLGVPIWFDEVVH